MDLPRRLWLSQGRNNSTKWEHFPQLCLLPGKRKVVPSWAEVWAKIWEAEIYLVLFKLLKVEGCARAGTMGIKPRVERARAPALTLTEQNSHRVPALTGNMGRLLSRAVWIYTVVCSITARWPVCARGHGCVLSSAVGWVLCYSLLQSKSRRQELFPPLAGEAADA